MSLIIGADILLFNHSKDVSGLAHAMYNSKDSEGTNLNLIIGDIPGIIEGAHDGKGLGIQFLKHIQRTRILLFLIDINSLDPVKDYGVLKKELHIYDPYLDKKPHIVALSKVDTVTPEDRDEIVKMLKSEFEERMQENIITISSITKENLTLLKKELFKIVTEQNE